MQTKLLAYLKLWQLSEPKHITTTATSQVYHVRLNQEPAILKLLTRIGEIDEANAPIALRAFRGRGAIRVIKYDAHAHLLEYADGQSLLPMVKRGEDTQATQIIADTIKTMHSAVKDTHNQQLTPLSQWCRSLFSRAKRDTQSQHDSLYHHGAAVARYLLDSPQDECVLHGDIHHTNLLHSAERGWLAIDPKGIYGERTYDLANTLCNPVELPDVVLDEKRLLANAQILAEVNGIPLERVLAFTFMYACLSASWSENDQQNPGAALGVAHLLAPHVKIDG